MNLLCKARTLTVYDRPMSENTNNTVMLVQDSINHTFSDTFLTLPREKLLILTRRHILFPIQSIIVILFLSSFLFVVLLALSVFSLIPLPFFLVSVFIICALALTFISKAVVDWYFHFYFVTTRKIAEVCYLPLSKHFVNEILLDRVKCTEIDVTKNGIIGHLLDIGNVSITFDRPTHQEEFVFWNVKKSREIGTLLTQKLIEQYGEEAQKTVWYKSPHRAQPYTITDEIAFAN